MSHQALHRVSVRMLFDPELAQRVQQGEAVAGLTEQELGWLRAVDPRAWTVDHQRPARTLRELTREFKASAALAVGAEGRIAPLSRFFQSEAFHRCVQERGSLDIAFAEHLGALGVHPGVLALEAALARCRREDDRSPRMQGPRGHLVRAAGVGALVVDSSTLPTLNRVEQCLFELSLQPLFALAEDGPRLPDLPPPTQEEDHLVLQPRHGEWLPTRLGQVVCRTLVAHERPRPEQHFAALCGLPDRVAPKLLVDLLQAGLLTRR